MLNNPFGLELILPEEECKKLLLLGDSCVTNKHIEYKEGIASIYRNPPYRPQDNAVDALRYTLKQNFTG